MKIYFLPAHFQVGTNGPILNKESPRPFIGGFSLISSLGSWASQATLHSAELIFLYHSAPHWVTQRLFYYLDMNDLILVWYRHREK